MWNQADIVQLSCFIATCHKAQRRHAFSTLPYRHPGFRNLVARTFLCSIVLNLCRPVKNQITITLFDNLFRPSRRLCGCSDDECCDNFKPRCRTACGGHGYRFTRTKSYPTLLFKHDSNSLTSGPFSKNASFRILFTACLCWTLFL